MSYYLPNYPMLDSDIIRRQLAYSGVDVAPQPQPTAPSTVSKSNPAANSNDVGEAGIMAGAGLFGTLMKQKAEREAQKAKLEFDAEDQKYKNLAKASQTLSKGQQDALMRLITNLRGATL